MSDVLLFGIGSIVTLFFGFLLLFAGGYGIHLVFEKLERNREKKNAMANGDGYYLNDEYLSPEALVKRADNMDGDLSARLRTLNGEAAFKQLVTKNARVERERDRLR
jgi:hypothetical protein